MPASKVKAYMAAARQPKSLDTPLFKPTDKSADEGALLVDTVEATEDVDEEARDRERCARSQNLPNTICFRLLLQPTVICDP